MGLSISSVSFSCVDCSSRLNTIEELEASWKLQSKDLRVLEEDSGFKDEFTVFRSQSRINDNEDEAVLEPLQRISVQSSSANETISTSPEKNKKEKVRAGTSINVIRNFDDMNSSEVSTPTVLVRPYKHKTYSRNFSELSINLVDTVRSVKNN